MNARVLYLTYDGLTDPLGQSQVLPYLRGLAAKGHRITVVSCEKPEARAVREDRITQECAAAGIDWQPLRYTKSPPVLSTLADLRRLRHRAVALHNVEPFDIVHCRSYLTALTGRAMQRTFGTRLLFDMRGFWIDERFERGIWSPVNPLYRAIAGWLRKRERELFGHADAVVTLTHAAKDELRRRGGAGWADKTAVIPCCADLDHFDPGSGAARSEGRAMLGLAADTPVLLFLGSLGGAYPLEPVFRFFRRWSEGQGDARLLFVTRHPPADVLDHPDAQGLGSQILVRPGERAEMPALIAAADAGLSFILPTFCASASSPTTVGEMLAMGVPVVANAGVGDMNRIFAEPGAGVLLPDLSVEALSHAARLIWQCRSRLQPRAAAERWFALNFGVGCYDEVYQRLIPKPQQASR